MAFVAALIALSFALYQARFWDASPSSATFWKPFLSLCVLGLLVAAFIVAAISATGGATGLTQGQRALILDALIVGFICVALKPAVQQGRVLLSGIRQRRWWTGPYTGILSVRVDASLYAFVWVLVFALVPMDGSGHLSDATVFATFVCALWTGVTHQIGRRWAKRIS